MRVRGSILLSSLAVGLAACTGILGDFSVGSGSDASTDASDVDVSKDVATTDVVVVDSPADVKQDVAPTCGVIGLACCNGACTTGSCCGSTCADTTKDSKNCGACGHDCLAGQCGSSACTPTALGTVASKMPSVIAVDANVVYWGQINGGGSLQAGGIYVCDKVNGCGNNPVTLFGKVDYPRSLVVYNNTTYTADGNAGILYDCPANGCSGVPGAHGPLSNLTSIGIEGGVLFYLSSGQLFQSNLDTTFPITLSTAAQSGSDLVVSNQDVYYTNFSNVRYAKQGAQTSASDFFAGVAGEQYGRIATDGQYVYFHAYVTSTQDDSVFACPAGSPCTARTILATGQHFSYATAGLAADSGNAYWTAMNGKDVYVRKCAATGCNNAPVEVAHVAASGFSPWVGGVAVDASYAYFLLDDTGTTTLYRVVK